MGKVAILNSVEPHYWTGTQLKTYDWQAPYRQPGCSAVRVPIEMFRMETSHLLDVHGRQIVDFLTLLDPNEFDHVVFIDKSAGPFDRHIPHVFTRNLVLKLKFG